MNLDTVEQKIFHILQREGRISNVDLAERIGLSESPCFRRVRQLEENGLIQGYRACVDQRKLGLQVTAYVHITLEKDDELKQAFLQRVSQEAHIVECHAMSGHHDYLLKVVAHSIDHFSTLSMDGILKYPGVKDMESQFSLKEIKQTLAYPVTT